MLLAPTQKAYAQICRLITTGRRLAAKGEYKLKRADFESGLDECLALWIPSPDPRLSVASWLKDLFRDRCWIGVELHRGADDAQSLSTLRRLSQSIGLPLLAAGDVHMHVRERRALQDIVTAIRHGCTLANAGHRLFANGERHLRSLEDLAAVYPANLLEETVRVAERCEFSLDVLRYHYPRELDAEEHDACATSAQPY